MPLAPSPPGGAHFSGTSSSGVPPGPRWVLGSGAGSADSVFAGSRGESDCNLPINQTVPDEAGTVSVRARGLSRPDRKVLGFLALMYPLYILGALFLTVGGWRDDTWVKVAVGSGALVVMALLFLEITSQPRAVVISARGVVFRYRLHSERRDWASFDPLVKPAWGPWADGGWWISYPLGHRKDLTKRRGHWLTDEQARAILDYPSGKNWTLTPQIQDLLRAGDANENPSL